VVSFWYHYGMAMTLRLTSELDQNLEATSERLGISKQQAVTKAVEMYIDAMAEHQQVLDAMDALMVQDKKLMERLADA
jgi:predicted DNA-binding protein